MQSQTQTNLCSSVQTQAKTQENNKIQNGNEKQQIGSPHSGILGKPSNGDKRSVQNQGTSSNQTKEVVSKAQKDQKTDHNLNHIFHLGEIISNVKKNKFYKAKEFIGKGTFGQVLEVHEVNKDQQHQHTMAMKVIKKQAAYTNQGLIQIKNLREIAKYEQLVGGSRKNYLNLYDAFMWEGSLCIAMELLDNSVLNILQSSGYKGLEMKWIEKWAKQLLLALAKIHTLGILHCDIKPENIMFRPNQPQNPLFIDFSSSCSKNSQLFTYIQSRFYRSPEALLGFKPYSQKIDIWSLGCVLAEMYLGLPIFPGASSYDQIDKIWSLIGNRLYTQNLQQMLRNSDFGLNFFIIELPSKSEKSVQTEIEDSGFYRKPNPLEHTGDQQTQHQIKVRLKTLQQYAKVNQFQCQLVVNKVQINQSYFCLQNIEDMINLRNPSPKDIQTHELFIDLLKKMLAFHPDQRISAQQAFLHPFIGGLYSELTLIRSLEEIIEAQKIKKQQQNKEQENGK